MNENGKNANALIRQMKLLYEEISSLLRIADKFMLKKNWGPEAGNTALQGSRNIDAPSYWIPQDIFRFYSNSNHDHILTYIAVIIHHRDNETKLTEPLLSCGLLDYGKGNKIQAWDYWYAHMHVYQKHFDIDGELREIETAFFDKELLKKKIQRAHSLAVPLMDITDSSSLETQIILPLIDGIESSNESNIEEGQDGSSSEEA